MPFPGTCVLGNLSRCLQRLILVALVNDIGIPTGRNGGREGRGIYVGPICLGMSVVESAASVAPLP